MTRDEYDELQKRIRGAFRWRGIQPDDELMAEATAKAWENMANGTRTTTAIMRAVCDLAARGAIQSQLAEEFATECYGMARRVDHDGAPVRTFVARCVTLETPETRRRSFVKPGDWSNPRYSSLTAVSYAGAAVAEMMVTAGIENLLAANLP